MTLNLYWEFPHASSEDQQSIQSMIEYVNKLEINSALTGSLLYFHHTSLDPWMIAVRLIQETTRHIPLIALQPYAVPPATAAMMIHTIYRLYGRQVNVNLITGGLPANLKQIGNQLTKEERFYRLIEYCQILRELLTSNSPLTFTGLYYQYNRLELGTALPDSHFPRFFVPLINATVPSLSALEQADVAVTIPKTFHHYKENFLRFVDGRSQEFAIKINIITRPTAAEAFKYAESLDLEEFKLQRIMKKIMNNESALSKEEDRILFPSWGPSLLVGSYDQIGSYLHAYVVTGVRHFILPYLKSVQDLNHIEAALSRIDKITNHSSSVDYTID